MFDRSIRSLRLSFSPTQRLVVISDLHANLPVLKELLQKINYQENEDELILLGDLLEKGKYNLATLYYIMEISKNPHVHPIIGNCDFVCLNIFHHHRLDFLLDILLKRKYSIIHEMAKLVNFSITKDCNMELLANLLIKNFPKELAFINSLPHVIESEDYIFAHAAILNEHTYGESTRDVMTHQLFLEEDYHFHKYVIVGHLPVSEYCNRIASFQPIIDEDKKIICIDGGNVVKESGQLNAFLIQNHQFSSIYVDTLVRKEIRQDYEEPTIDPFFITWHHSEIQILKENATRAYCYHVASKRCLWIPHSFIYQARDKKLHAPNYTTYHMPVHKGDQVGIISYNGDEVYIKKAGILGWIPTACLQEHDS
ncbi:MAG: metallophosphoesterase [Longicatena sp.]